MINATDIIISPILSEKSNSLSEQFNKYAFKVNVKSNKLEIKRAIEGKFDVEVAKVATMNRMGKEKNMTVKSGGRTIRTQGNRASWKKAIVTLKEGHEIDLLRGEVAE